MLLFTNIRAQSELWFEALTRKRPDLLGSVALHHGSIEQKIRKRIDDLLRHGSLRCLVCTSSLDLGVDFSSVDQVIQVGSPKGDARLVRRAGRSEHGPDGQPSVECIPTHASEMVESAAARHTQSAGLIEARVPFQRSLDVLVQHLVTIALGSGFTEQGLRKEIQTTHAFGQLDDAEWAWCTRLC